MSGIEVVGLVLGILPLAIQAVDSYMTVFSSFKTAQNDLKWLKWNLETEQVNLRTTCEHLLHEIARPEMIDPMIKRPFGSEWAQYNEKLRMRLWTSWGLFQKQIQVLSEAAKELEEKLSLHNSSEIRCKDYHTVLRELKMRAAFTLKKKDYEDLLQKIQSTNQRLQRFVQPDSSLKSSRQLRSQNRVIRLFRGMSHSIFTAMYSAVTCKCAKTHSIGIELAARKAVLLPDDEEDEVAERFQYNVVIDSAESPAEWNHAKLQLDRTAPVSTEKSSMVDPFHMPPEQSRKQVTWRLPNATARMQPKSVETPSVVQTLIQSSGTVSSLLVPTLSQHKSTPQIADLCQVFHGERNALSDSKDYGHLSDTQKRRFRLSPPPSEEPSRFSNTATLRDLISGANDIPKASILGFGYEERLQLALTLANSVLYTYNTPWLNQSITLKDIAFFLESNEETPRQGYQSIYRPFVTKTVPSSNHDASQDQTVRSQRMINTTLLSVGALLIQIITGTVQDTLDLPKIMNLEDVQARHEIASQLEARVIENGGPNYARAVKWCFDNAIGLAGFQNNEFCQEFCEVVVALLEQDAALLEEQERNCYNEGMR